MKKMNLISMALASALPFSSLLFDAHAHVGSAHNGALTNKTDLALDMHAHRIAKINHLDSYAVLSNIATAAQKSLLTSIKQQNPNATVRQNPETGMVESVFGIAIASQGGSPESAASAFLNEYQALFPGLDLSQLVINPHRSKAALGGHLVRFDQAIGGIKIKHAGIGIVMDSEQRIRAVMADYHPNATLVNTQGISSDAAVLTAKADLAAFQKQLPLEALNALAPAYEVMKKQLGVFATPQPHQVIVKQGDSHKLAWQFFYYSTNPFGVFEYVIDAQTGEVLARTDKVKTLVPGTEDGTSALQTGALPVTADYFPTFPPITDGMQDSCIIEDESGGVTGTPKGMARINVRKFDDTNRVTGVEGLLTGTHALIESAMPTKGPFAQAALGTYHFSQDAQPLEARPTEADHVTPSPAHHLDGISQFIYITNLLEYLDYLHKDGDDVHSRGVGDGSFPNSYPNEAVPLAGVVHIPNVLDPPDDPSDPEFAAKLLGLDNAFAVPLSQEIAGQEVVVNPTAYGHGYLFNNLALDFSVPMHEGTHATITPIAGFEGEPEGSALNEGQADLWAYSIGETPDLGTYPVNSCDLRQYLRDLGIDPNSYEYIRSAQSQIRYSQLGTRDNAFQEHRDGEIYAGSMWDLREIMTTIAPEVQFKRPDPVTGEPTQDASVGKETWERIFLGSMYVLGLTAPDTFVKARDAVLIADSVLYPTDPMDLNAPGRHHALIERVFAAREIGVNAKAPLGGRQTVSTAVSEFTANQAAPQTPQNVLAEIISEDEVKVSWNSVPDAIGYQVLKRRKGNPMRLFQGVPNREYYEGDVTFSGYTHVEFVLGDTQYSDIGQGFGRGRGQGIDSFDYDYVVRAIGVNSTQQVGFSKLSGVASTAMDAVDVTNDVSTRVANVSFVESEFAFDLTLVNDSATKIYGPVSLTITDISNSSVTAMNADNGGDGQTAGARFDFQGPLESGRTTMPRHLKFHNPNAQLFTFDAVVSGYHVGTATAGNGEQAPMDTSAPRQQEVVYHNIEERTGLVVIGSTEQTLVNGVDYVDVVFTALPSATSVVATLSTDVDLIAYPDLDFLLLDANGNEMASSGNLGSNEQVGGGLIPGEDYILRVNGYANGPTTFKVVIDQFVTDPADANTQSSSNSGSTMRFEYNPASGAVKALGLLR